MYKTDINYSPTELIITNDGAIFHLGIRPDQMAQKVILVGDQDRVDIIAEELDTIEYRVQNREFKSACGSIKGKQVLILSTGIGPDNMDIVLNELDALINIDFETRKPKKNRTKLELIRVGTCGLLHGCSPVGSHALSIGAIGLDNLAHFYADGFSDQEKAAANSFKEKFNIPKKVFPYASIASPEIIIKLRTPTTQLGWTITAPGFYGPQGRQLRARINDNHFVHELEHNELGEWPLINFEMESSALFFLANQLGHAAGTICLGIANRPKGKFLKDYSKEMKNLARFVLEKI